jgi:predicted Zn-dependent protease
VALSKESSILCLSALLEIEGGQEAKARTIASEFEKRLEPEPRSYGKLIEAAVLLKHGKAPDAIGLLEQASKLTDSWMARFTLGRAYLAAGAFTEADAELDHCLKRRGEATEMFLDDLPTYHFVPQVYYYLGRAQEGLKSAGAKDSYRTYLSLKQKADVDPLVNDARKREAR